jgi:general secretion pathway protein D
MTCKQHRRRWLRIMTTAGGCVALAVSLAQPGSAQTPAAATPAAGALLPFGLRAAPAQVPAQAPVPNAPTLGLSSVALPGAAASTAQAKPVAQLPKGPTQLIDLPRLENRAIVELINSLITQFEIAHDYAPASEAQQKLIAVPTAVVAVGPTLVRTDAQKNTLLMRFGQLRRPGQLPQLWVRGIVASDVSSINPDSALIEPAVVAILASRDKSEAEIPFTGLSSQTINLAYIDADGAIGMLKAMGFNVSSADKPPAAAVPPTGVNPILLGAANTAAAAPAPSQRRVRNQELPIVIRMPAPTPQDVGLVGAAADGAMAAAGTGQNGVTSILGTSGRLSTETLSSPTSRLMVLYNPEHPEQLGQVRKALSESIDTPARQIVIEAMVLEVTSNGLRDLGVQWNYQKGLNTLTIGSLTAGSGANTLGFLRNTSIAEAAKAFFVKVEALVQTGKAEVLARPSVLTLDNRQASIRVGTDIPIATSRDASSSAESRVSYSFFYLPTGIQLNVRPRIDNDGREVSLQVDAAVSTTVANLGTQIRSPGDVVLAAAPAVSTRRVQTYARIPNSTPLIIGGLISRTRDDVKDATPLLGELPVLGHLFSAKKETSTRDEVIIVLTPYVLEHGRAGIEAALPKDAPAFEYSRDNALFRKNVRLRAEDTINLAYIRENARLLRYRNIARRVAAVDPTRVEQSPLRRVASERTPGEASLMTGMLYRVIANYHVGTPVPAERMQLFMERDKGEVVVRSLAEVLARLGDGRDPDSFFSGNPDKCVAITFSASRHVLQAGNVLDEPEPRVRTVDCKPDRSDWSRILYEMNRNTGDAVFHTILLKDKSDLLRLSHAIALRRLIQINGGKAAVDFNHLGIGRVLSLPEFGEDQRHLLEADVADYFYLSQHSLREFEQEFESAMAEIDKALRSGNFNGMVPASELLSTVP